MDWTAAAIAATDSTAAMATRTAGTVGTAAMGTTGTTATIVTIVHKDSRTDKANGEFERGSSARSKNEHCDWHSWGGQSLAASRVEQLVVQGLLDTQYMGELQ